MVKNLPANAGDTGLSPGPEDPKCRGATKPGCHDYWAHVPQLLKPVRLEPVLRNKRSHRNEKPAHRSPQLEKTRTQQRRPNAAINE